MTSTIVLNAVLFAAIVTALVWLLAHPGIKKSRHHELRLFRWHSLRTAARRH